MKKLVLFLIYFLFNINLNAQKSIIDDSTRALVKTSLNKLVNTNSIDEKINI